MLPAMKFLMLFLFTALAVPTRASTINEAEYSTQYQVIVTSRVGGFMIGNFCTMSLRDQVQTNMAFIVQRRSHGACHVWDSGTIFHGRREKNDIKLLTIDDKGKQKVEDWPITGTVALNPPVAK
jgi:hypothetical protein